MKKTTTVTLRTQKLKDGRESFLIETYKNGVRKRKSIGVYLIPGRTEEAKIHNKEARFIANEMLKKEEQISLKRDLGFVVSYSEVRMFDYFKNHIDKIESSNKDTWETMFKYLQKYERNANFLMSDITPYWVESFKEFLLSTDRILFDKLKNKDGKSPKLMQNSAKTIFTAFLNVMRDAVKKDNVIPFNPCENISNIRSEETHREYLTTEEIEKMKNVRIDGGTRYNACLFSMLTGLRWSDISTLRWKHIIESQGYYSIDKRLVKKKNFAALPLSEEAVPLMGIRRDEEDLVFDGIGCYSSMERYVVQWAKKAGIQKHITFHSFRHTFGTLLVNSGVDLYTTSKLMGHRSIKSTEIYAKIMDKTKRDAIDKMPKLL